MRGKVTMAIGVVLIVLGIVSFVWKGFTVEHEEKILDIGPIEATRTDRDHVPLPPLLGAIALAGGVALVAIGARAK